MSLKTDINFLKSLPLSFLPQHVVLVPDGNRRWAKKHGLALKLGHRAGAENFHRIIKMLYGSGLEVLSLSFWALSLDNVVKRTKTELEAIFELTEEAFSRIGESPDIYKNEVKINAFGEWEKYFPERTRKTIKSVLQKTRKHKGHFLNFFLAYDGHKEILDAVEKIRQAPSDERITAKLFKSYLYTRDLPPIDFIIRTGGEPHWSAGAFLWEAAYSQLYFTRKLWPDFGAGDFVKALINYTRRGRRFGE